MERNTAAYRVSYKRWGGGGRGNVGSKRRRPAYFRELKVLTCVGGQFTEESAAHLAPNPEPWNSQGVEQHVCCEEGGGGVGILIPCPPHALNSPAVNQPACREGWSPSPRPSLVFVFAGGFCQQKKEHFYSQMWFWKQQQPRGVGGGSSNIPSLENIVNKDLAEQGELKRNPPVGWGVGAVRKEL